MSNGARDIKYPFEPLIKAVGAPSILQMAEPTGVTIRTLHRWKKNGIPERSGDEVAVRINSHIAYIWPDEYRRQAQVES